MSTATASRTRGRKRELAWLQKRRDEGWVAYRIDGCGDIVEGLGGVTNIIQVKSTVRPYSCFLPAERELLKWEAERSGWNAFLLWWPKGRGIEDAELIPAEDWP